MSAGVSGHTRYLASSRQRFRLEDKPSLDEYTEAFSNIASEMPSLPSDGQSTAANVKLIDLNKPEKLSNVLKKDVDDCLPCRLMGRNFTLL